MRLSLIIFSSEKTQGVSTWYVGKGRTPGPSLGRRFSPGFRASSFLGSLRIEAVCPGSSSSTLWTAARGERRAQSTCPWAWTHCRGRTSPGKPRRPGRPWGGSPAALTLVPNTRSLILPAGGDGTAPQPGQGWEPPAAPDAEGLAPPLQRHCGNPGRFSGGGGLWPLTRRVRRPGRRERGQGPAGHSRRGGRAVGAPRPAGGRARQAGSRGLSAGPRRPWRERGPRR